MHTARVGAIDNYFVYGGSIMYRQRVRALVTYARLSCVLGSREVARVSTACTLDAHVPISLPLHVSRGD